MTPWTVISHPLLYMALALVVGGFADAVPPAAALYLKDAGMVFTGIAGLLMNPPKGSTVSG